MKKIFILSTIVLISCVCFSQSIGIGTATPNSSAVLDITNSSKGLLIPRMTTTAINAIANPAKGLMVYDSTTNQMMVNMGTPASKNWQSITSKSSWSLGGNSGTNVVTQFVGTTDNKPLRFRVNGIRAGELSPATGNILFGLRAGENATTGYSNIAIGSGALRSTTVLGNLVAIGDSALMNSVAGDGSNVNHGQYNTAIGSKSMYSNTTGFYNTATGYRSLFSNTTGWYNSAYGLNSMYNNTTGAQNTAVGISTMFLNTVGSYNTAMGFDALYTNNGYSNVGIGYSALAATGGGSYNTAVGTSALNVTSEASYNVGIGYQAGQSNVGWNNVFVGALANAAWNGLYNCVAVGQGAQVTASSQVRIGNTSTVSIGGQVGWSNLSDGRYKKNIREDVKGIDFIMKLRPVTYQIDIAGLNSKLKINNESNEFAGKAAADQKNMVFTGFVAQEVEQAAKDLGYDFSGVDKPKNENDLYALRYAEFVVPLVKAMQEQQQMIIELKKQNTDLQRRVGELEKK